MPDNGPSWTDVLSAIFAGVSAIAAAVSVWEARKSSTQIGEQRTDECVSSARGLKAALGRLISNRKRQSHADQRTFDDYDRLWEGWTRFDEAFGAARRYHREVLSPDIPKNVAEKIRSLEKILRQDWQPTAPASKTADEIQSDVGKLLAMLDQL